MLLHFKLNCFIFVMLLGHVNLFKVAEKVSSSGGNVDAFFDPSVDDLQDNFYDIPFISNIAAVANKNNDEELIEQFQPEFLSEHDIFQFGREKLEPPVKFKTNTDADNNNNESKNKRNIDECFEQSLNDSSASSSSTLLESVVEKFNQIGKEKNSLHLRMQNIEDDEAILENQKNTFKFKRNTNNNDKEVLNRKKRHYINSIYFSHKYRHKKPSINSFVYDDDDDESAQINKRTCNNKRPRMPHKHRTMNGPLLMSKHEEFKDDMMQDAACNVKASDGALAPDDSGCHTTTVKHKEHAASRATTKNNKLKHQTTTVLKAKQQQTKEKCTAKAKLVTMEPAKKPVAPTKHQFAADKQKSSIPPTKPSIKSVLCRKNPKTTTSSTNEFGEYEDYKAGDYKDFIDQTQEDRVKRDKSQEGNCDGGNSAKAEKNAIDEFLREETTVSFNSGQSMVASGMKKHKEDAIDQFLKEETTKADYHLNSPQTELKRNVHQFVLNSDDDNDAPPMKTETNENQNKIDRFINAEVPKTKIFQFAASTENGPPLQKHKQLMKTERNHRKKVQSNRNELQAKRTAFLTPIFNNERVYQKKMKIQHKGQPLYETTEAIVTSDDRGRASTDDADIYKIIQLMSSTTSEKYPRSSTHEKRLKPQIYIVKSKNEEDDENDVKFKQRIFMVKPKLKQNFDDSKKLKVNPDEDAEEGEKYSEKNSLKHFEQIVSNYEKTKATNRMEPSEAEIINYLKKIIHSQQFHQFNKDDNENIVNIKESNKFAESTKHPERKLYVAHTKNQGRQHHRIYFEPEKITKTKQKIKSKTETIGRNLRGDYYNKYETTESRYEKFLERLKNKDMFRGDNGEKKESTTKKIKHQTEDDNEPLAETPETEENPEITELYSEIPVNRKRIQLSLNCDGTDYLNKDHCICSVKTMLRDLMDDLKDISTSLNYQYDCGKFIGIEPGVVIANDSRRMLTAVARNRRHTIYSSFLLKRKGSRIGRDVDNLLNENLNVDNLENFVYATVGSKVVLHCGNTSTDYNEDDKIVWTIQNGAPETAGFKEDNGRELIIERASAQDTNNYSCAIAHRLEDGSYGPPQKFLHKLSIVEIPIYSLMITVILNESAKCEQEDLETLHNYYPIILNKFLCNGAEQICSVSVDKPHCTKSHSENGVQMHATLKTLPLYTILPALRKKQQICDINCQSRIYSIIVKTLQNNFASVANLPGIIKSIKNFSQYSMKSATKRTCSQIRF